MATAVPKKQVLSLYKSLMKESKKLTNYNFRMVAKKINEYPFYEYLLDTTLLRHKIYIPTEENLMSYALRRIRDGFKENKSLTDPKLMKKQFDFGKENLEIIKRQAIIGAMYQTEKLVIENIR